MTTELGELLAEAGKRLQDRLEAEVLAAHVLRRNRAWLFAHPEFAPNDNQRRHLLELVARREAGEPVAYLTGRREFWGLELRVDQHTLIPRADTELLIEIALDLPLPERARVADLGTGSGAIALALALERPGWRILATDASPDALAVARSNATKLALSDLRFSQGDWCGALADEASFDLIVSNPPYIRNDDPHLRQGDLPYEPAAALASGPDGLDAIGAIADCARSHLAAGGHLLLEHGFDQGKVVRELLLAHHYQEVGTRRDLAGHERATLARRPA